MDWGKGQESENVEDRRGMGPTTIAVGGLGTLVVLLIGLFLGIDPQKLNQLVGNAPVAGGGNARVRERAPTAEEARSRRFAATILGFTEQVWGEQFRRAGKIYAPPHMVL